MPIRKRTRSTTSSTSQRKYVGTGVKRGKAIDRVIEDGLRRRRSPRAVQRDVAGLVGLSERDRMAVWNYRNALRSSDLDLSPAEISVRSAAYVDRLKAARAQSIVTTEITALDSAQYEPGDRVLWHAEPGCCDACTSMHGVMITVGEGTILPPAHPNCRCRVSVLTAH